MLKKTFIIIFCLLEFIALYGQGIRYEGPDDEAGDIAAEREGYMIGNRVFLYFRNTTELSDWPKAEVSRWPNTYDGVKMLDGIGLLIAARVYLEKDTIPVTDLVDVRIRKDLDTLFYLQTSYREEMDKDPTGTVEWGLYPVFGYFNEGYEYPAMSNLPNSWPSAGWPSTGRVLKWPGEWDGRFGRGVSYADLETYFVTNDAQDQEYLGVEDRVKYYPRKDRKIGAYRPTTIQNNLPWGGVGVRVEQRGFQWNNPQARDAIFWEYSIANTSDYDLTEVAFGYWVDNAIGGDADDERGFFDVQIDLAYSWDVNGVGSGGLRTGTMGFAYLESPGMGYDGVDNDNDGLLDEKRDNIAQQKIGPYAGIQDMNKFLNYYKLTMEDLKEHWDADEDQDWEDGIDDNQDGIYQITEYVGDDVGLDGVGPAELNYTGPDFGECNHKPDYQEGIGCEPNFAETDVSESDMLGLTAFRMLPVPAHSSELNWFRGDRSMWDLIGIDTLEEYMGNISNLIEIFASGVFPLFQGRVERISMSELHSYDQLEGLNSLTHNAPALYEQKRIVQIIYEKDYRFAQPPKMPTLKATPGDGKVILTWDDVADKKTRDPFVGNTNDFEGYKLYRATDKKFSDCEVITDGYGTPMFKKPIFQCDLIDTRMGFTNFGLVNGMGYNLGSDNGITHYFVDNNVQNGRTYYYAIVAYDYGAPNIGPGIAPSENNIVIELDESEEIRSVGKNVQVVTPHQLASGYVSPNIEINSTKVKFGTGNILPEILAKNSLQPGNLYRVTFAIDTLYKVDDYDHGLLYTTSGFYVHDSTNTLLYKEDPQGFAYKNIAYEDTLQYWYLKSGETIWSDIFDGLRLQFTFDYRFAEYDPVQSGWVSGSGPIAITPTIKESKYFPWDYDIVFTDRSDVYTGRVTNKTMKDQDDKRINRAELLVNQKFSFYVVNKLFVDSAGNYETMDLVVHDLNKNNQFDILSDRILVGPVTNKGNWGGTVFVLDFMNYSDLVNLPSNNNLYRIKFHRPYWVQDTLLFRIVSEGSIDITALEEDMKQIKVVPNPYIATNMMEPSVANWYLNQRRRILFTHLPADCVIKIFTVSGVQVTEIPVKNSADNGTAYWDLLTHEGLETAPGVYIYHVKSTVTGHEKIGKFAIIK